MKSIITSIKQYHLKGVEKFPFIYYLLLAIITFWPLTICGYALQYDAIDVYLPWRFFGSESMQQGMIPLWNPYQDGGYPFYADLQYSIWNPEFFIGSLFGRFNATSIAWLYILYCVIGGLGFRRLALHFKLDKTTAFLGGIIFLFSGVLIGHAQSIISILGAIWLPWALYGYLYFIRNKYKWKDALLASLFLYIMLVAGYQAVSIMLFYILLTFALIHLVQLVKDKNFQLLKHFILSHLLIGFVLLVLLSGTFYSLIEVSPYLGRLDGLSIEDTSKILFHPKSLISTVFPLASVQQEFSHSAISAQNIFSGTAILLGIIIGLRQLKKYITSELIVLLIFGIIYGVASFGNFTPFQPLLANLIPGFDQFFYANFYRFFAWIPLLLIGLYGIQQLLNNGNRKLTTWFFIGGAIFYLTFFIVQIEGIGQFITLLKTKGFGETIRTMGIPTAISLESLLHFLLFLPFIGLMFVTKNKKFILPLFIVAEMIFVSQLNIPITVVGKTKISTLNDYLATKAIGFPKIDIDIPIGDNGSDFQHASIWRNQGNFTNEPKLFGFTSFHLKNRDHAYDKGDEFLQKLNEKSWAYLVDTNSNLDLIRFKPSYFKFKINAAEATQFILQQSDYPGWKISLDGKQITSSIINEFEQKVEIPKGQHSLTFEFENPIVYFLFYLNHVGFIILVLLVLILCWHPRTKNQKMITVSSLFVVFMVLISLNLRKTVVTNQDITLKSANKTIWKTERHLNKESKQKLIDVLSKEPQNITISNNNFDVNPELLATFLFFYKKKHYNKNQFDFIAKTPLINNAIEILEAGTFYDINPPSFPKGTPFYITYSGIIKTKVFNNIILVIEVNRLNRNKIYKAIELDNKNSLNNSVFISNGILLPELDEYDQVKMYLWNNSTNDVEFSNFNSDWINYQKAK